MSSGIDLQMRMAHAMIALDLGTTPFQGQGSATGRLRFPPDLPKWDFPRPEKIPACGALILVGHHGDKTRSFEILKGREGGALRMDMDFRQLEERVLAAMLKQGFPGAFEPGFAPLTLDDFPADLYPGAQLYLGRVRKVADHKRATKRTPNTGPKRRW